MPAIWDHGPPRAWEHPPSVPQPARLEMRPESLSHEMTAQMAAAVVLAAIRRMGAGGGAGCMARRGGRRKGRDLPWWGGSRPSIRRMLGSGSRSDHVAVESLPVVEVVEVDGILEGAGVLDIVFGEDGLAGGVVVDVARDGGIEFADGFGVEVAAFFLKDPDFEFRVGRFAVADEGEEVLAVDAEAVEDHLVVSFAAGWVIVVEFSGGTEAGLLPEAWEVEDAEGAGDARGDDWNEFH